MTENIKELCTGDKDLVIKLEEHYGDNCLFDSNSMSDQMFNPEKRIQQGFVEIYKVKEGKKKLLGKKN